MDEIKDEEYRDALVIVLDTSEPHLISDERYKLGKFIIKIDHHISQNDYGNLNCVDTSFESCAGLIANILISENIPLNSPSAKSLFTGIVTDSGRFRYDSVSARTFAIVSKLLEYNFSISEVYNELYLEDLESIRLKAYFMLNFKLTKHNVAYMKNTHEDIIRHHSNFYNFSRNG